MAIQERDQATALERLAKLVFEMTRDVKYLLDNHHPEIVQGRPMGGQTLHPNARERADELHTTLRETQEFFGVIPDSREG